MNRTGEPREFVPQFTLLTDTGKRIEEAVLPLAVPLIQGREDKSIPLLGAVDVVGVIPPSTKANIDDAVYGVALWDNVDPKADRLSIYVRGLSDGFQETKGPDGKAVVKYKTLRIDLIRRGDERNLNEKEISPPPTRPTSGSTGERGPTDAPKADTDQPTRRPARRTLPGAGVVAFPSGCPSRER